MLIAKLGIFFCNMTNIGCFLPPENNNEFKIICFKKMLKGKIMVTFYSCFCLHVSTVYVKSWILLMLSHESLCEQTFYV